ncbi:glycoside hydrolase family 9 protein [Chitinophaga lutea]
MKATGIAACLVLMQAAAFSQVMYNQAGYYPDAPKTAIVAGHTASSVFFLLQADSRDTVFRGNLGEERRSAYSSTVTRSADFSAWRKAGLYILVVPGTAPTPAFPIRERAYLDAAAATLRGYFYQRASMPLEQRYAGKWSRAAGHPDEQVLVHTSAADASRSAGTAIAAPGGWYDAGDYNKYVVNSGITVGTLLSAYEDAPGFYRTFDVNIPESGDRIPDILDEARYNLRWMLSMQDPHDGGVYHKCTNASFDGMIMPEKAYAPRYVVQKGTAATLNLAAVAAQASRVYKPFFPAWSDSCLRAAVRAWNWAVQHPDSVYDQDRLNKTFQPAIATGAYGDRQFTDEFFWAAAELLAATGAPQYAAVLDQSKGKAYGLPTWNSVGMLGYYTLLRNKASSPLTVEARQRIMTMAEDYLKKQADNAFGTIMGQSARDFNWGGNANAANQGILLIRAFHLGGDRKFLLAALTNVDYILGRNATGYSFLTGIGYKTPIHPHHRPSVADGIAEPVPGLLAGGPNAGMQDKCKYPFTEIETVYVDDDCSYASNEIAINWNAPLVYLLGAMEDLMK